MARVVLVHWNEKESAGRAERLRRAGYDVETVVPRGTEKLRALRVDPPCAIVIDLDRMPSNGRAVAVYLRQQKATRHVPLVLAGGDPEKVLLVRDLLPDAAFTGWARIASAVRGAVARPPAAPAVPGTMAGYSGTPLPKKLGIREGITVALLGAPEGFEATLGALPGGVRIRRDSRAVSGLVLLFVRSARALRQSLPGALRAVAEGGALWIAWPKQASGVRTDLREGEVRAAGLGAGLVDYKICAIDATWSGLRFARRAAAR